MVHRIGALLLRHSHLMGLVASLLLHGLLLREGLLVLLVLRLHTGIVRLRGSMNS